MDSALNPQEANVSRSMKPASRVAEPFNSSLGGWFDVLGTAIRIVRVVRSFLPTHPHARLMHFIKAWWIYYLASAISLTDSRLVVVCKRHTVSIRSPPVVTHTISCNVTPIAGESA